jgi:L-seryl-tRNA(Ser) seleniumtransferase
MTTLRDFVKRSVAASALVGLNPATAVAAAESAHPAPRPAVDYYDKLGVAKIINAAGTYTYLTASVMPDAVREAVSLAARHPVRLGPSACSAEARW